MIEWQTTIVAEIHSADEFENPDPVTFITQTLGDCLNVRRGLLARFGHDFDGDTLPPGVTVNISASSCWPVYVGSGKGFTPLQVSKIEGTEGILIRTRKTR